MQYIYLIKCQQFYKIGVANDVESRLAQLSTGNPFPLEVLAVYGFENANTVETVLHQRFSGARRRGEWFELTSENMADLKSICILLNGQKSELPTVQEEEIEEAEVLAQPADGAKWDYGSMFSDGWRIAPQGRNGRYWNWRRGNHNEESIYGGRISDLPYPIEEMRRIYRDGGSVTESAGVK